jgi:hypothetical protein
LCLVADPAAQPRKGLRSARCIDRTGLILEIFGRRARTREGTLQVELAHLNYQKSRLVSSWTHLERQRGGFGFLGGPGETQIEADRRHHPGDASRKIERELESVKDALPAPRQPQTRAISGGCARRLYQCRQVDPVQSADLGRASSPGPALRHARPDCAR